MKANGAIHRDNSWGVTLGGKVTNANIGKKLLVVVLSGQTLARKEILVFSSTPHNNGLLGEMHNLIAGGCGRVSSIDHIRGTWLGFSSP